MNEMKSRMLPNILGKPKLILNRQLVYSILSFLFYWHAPEYLTDMVVPVADLAEKCHL